MVVGGVVARQHNPSPFSNRKRGESEERDRYREKGRLSGQVVCAPPNNNSRKPTTLGVITMFYETCIIAIENNDFLLTPNYNTSIKQNTSRPKTDISQYIRIKQHILVT